MAVLVYLLMAAPFLIWPLFVLKRFFESFGWKQSKKEAGCLNLVTAVFGYLAVAVFHMLDSSNAPAGQPLTQYIDTKLISVYSSLAPAEIYTFQGWQLAGLIACCVLGGSKERVSPILYAICSSILGLNLLFTVNYMVHTVFQSNLYTFLLSASLGFTGLLYLAVMKDSMDRMMDSFERDSYQGEKKIIRWIYQQTSSYRRLTGLTALMLFPALFVLQLILVLFGQRPDGFIRIFFDTSSYLYSRIPAPPPVIIEGDAHYLCTVSLKGHKSLVRPIRAGIRNGERISVNRQLLIANAFEHLLEEYTPTLHRKIRNFYDKYGYPLSRHIRSSWSADAVYLLMKPLEWMFLLVLYTFDSKPENRIHIQYSSLRK